MSRIIYILSKPRVRVAIYLTIIVGVTLAVYYPTFVHLLRAEIYTYFMDTAGDNSAASLIANYYNYDKVRVFAPGDTLLFRPLLYTVLGIQKGLFGINYIYWHITAVVAHILVALCLFRLLWRIKPSIIALLATLLFSTSFIALTTVLYSILTSYLLCMALILTGFYYAYCGVKSGKKSHLAFASVSMLAACFFNELAIPLSVLLIGYFWLERKQPNFNWKPWSLIFLAVPILYLAVYIPSSLLVLFSAVVLFRARTHGTYYLLQHNFSIYFWVTLFIATAYALISFLKLTTKRTVLISLALIIFIGLNAPYTFISNRDTIAVEQPTRTYFQEIDNFIELHQGEQDLSFNSTFGHLPLDLYPWKEVDADGKNIGLHFTIPQVLYWDYWSKDNPKYTLVYYPDNSKLEVINNWEQP